jgi:Na+/phosphate symporter
MRESDLRANITRLGWPGLIVVPIVILYAFVAGWAIQRYPIGFLQTVSPYVWIQVLQGAIDGVVLGECLPITILTPAIVLAVCLRARFTNDVLTTSLQGYNAAVLGENVTQTTQATAFDTNRANTRQAWIASVSWMIGCLELALVACCIGEAFGATGPQYFTPFWSFVIGFVINAPVLILWVILLDAVLSKTRRRSQRPTQT